MRSKVITGPYFRTDFEGEFTVEPDSNADITVTFAPEEVGDFEGILHIHTNQPENPDVQVAMMGTGRDQEIREVDWWIRRGRVMVFW